MEAEKKQKSPKEMLRAYEKALAEKPDDVAAHCAAVALIEEHGLDTTPEQFSRPYNTLPLKQAYVQVIHAHQSMGQGEEALRYGRALCALDPDNGEVWISLGMLQLGAGNKAEAIDAFKKGLSLDPDNSHYRTYLTSALLISDISEFDAALKYWLGLFLREPGTINTSVLIRLWIKLFRSDPEFAVIRKGLAYKDYDGFKGWVDSLSAEESRVLASPYMLDALRIATVPDLEFERFLTFLRRRILGYAVNDKAPAPDWVLPLALSLAENCFLNEYLFDQSAEESAAVKALGLRLEDKKALSPLFVAAYGCYAPLYRHEAITKHYSGLFGGKDKTLKNLIKQQIADPLEEKNLAAKIPMLSEISDETSQKVRAQYEENPYPRWFSLGAADTEKDNIYAICSQDKTVREILIAGSGTGRHTIGVCKGNPHAIVTGIDLSLPSLAYARRKAQEMNIWNLNLVQGDLLDVGKLGRGFDVIESVGVLHHMQSPETGLEALVDVLNSEGMIKLGLYSGLARKSITECQNFIREMGFAATPEGIRAFRQELAAMPEDHPFRTFTRYDDYFSTSMVRDLLFHVQEITFTIPRIKRALESTGLKFLGFCSLDASVYRAYLAMFPDDAHMRNLDNWDAFEQQNPNTFIAMYQFWCENTF